MDKKISIHAPAWGATCRGGRQGHDVGHFNPRARVGRDEQITAKQHVLRDFNPRARVGRDNAHPEMTDYETEFQSTRPRGARP